ncbi:TauD/TfdA family dioxygenase [Allopusillimonas ginsengisoli]|nr:TauD/TfdA family dioxygenase [Allopusillimonas ginsengisoli]
MELVPLHADFGAEIKGLDLIDAVCDAQAFARVRAAFDEYSLLLWRRQDVTDDIQATFSRAFGALERTKVGSSGHGTFYSRMNNMGPDGNVVPPNDRALLIAKANQLWHTDSSFKALPAVASVLSARVIPSNGGDTEFVSTRAAWSRLDQETRDSLIDKVAIHSYATSRDQIDPGMMSAAERAALPPVRKPMTWLNPVNERRALYLASHAGAIEGMEPSAAQELLARLMEQATRPEHRYSHSWQQGDVLMWDNRATMHRGRPWRGGEARSIVRITISASEQDGLAQAMLGFSEELATA